VGLQLNPILRTSTGTSGGELETNHVMQQFHAMQHRASALNGLHCEDLAAAGADD
jgi:hypothetical protein